VSNDNAFEREMNGLFYNRHLIMRVFLTQTCVIEYKGCFQNS
jgi:hypothetical protein